MDKKVQEWNRSKEHLHRWPVTEDNVKQLDATEKVEWLEEFGGLRSEVDKNRFRGKNRLTRRYLNEDGIIWVDHK